MNLTFRQAIFLFLAGALGGALNAAAGGGSLVTFPVLLFTGVPPIPANVTNTFALWIGITASGGAYKNRLDISKTPAQTFLRVMLWLMLGATILFTFGKHLTGRISAGISRDAGDAVVAGACAFELLVAVYGGYFGAGWGS